MAKNDLELGAKWAAKSSEQKEPSHERMTMMSEGFARMNKNERSAKSTLDAKGHQKLAEEREKSRRTRGGMLVD